MNHNHLYQRGLLLLVTAVTLGGAISPIAHASYTPDYYAADSAPSLGENELITDPAAKHGLRNSARAAAAMDSGSGKFVYAKNANKRYAIASTTKLMTLYLAIQKAKKYGWGHKVRISRSLSNMSKSAELGNFRLGSGSYYTVHSLYLAALVDSSNSAAIALGQYVAGSNNRFITMMNKQAQAWGIGSQAHFVSASGLENSDLYPYGFRYGSKSDYNKVSARALTIIAQHLLDKYPSIVKDANKRTVYLDGQKMTNQNELLPGGYSYEASLKVDGLKTGYTPLAGYCLVSTSKYYGHRLILTTLHDKVGSKDQANMIATIYKYSSIFNK